MATKADYEEKAKYHRDQEAKEYGLESEYRSQSFYDSADTHREKAISHGNMAAEYERLAENAKE